MTKQEQRAKTARENGAKSKGPTTPEGKEKSSRNSMGTGAHASKLSLFVPPHGAALCNEDRKIFNQLIDELLAAYRPQNAASARIVREIAVARWDIGRLHILITSHWNLAIIAHGQIPSNLAPELLEVHTMARASVELYTGKSIVSRLNREIDRLENRILRLQRQFKNTPSEPDQPVENTQPVSENEPTVFVTENTPAVIEAYKSQFPNHKIVVLPADDVANGIDAADDLPFAPRKAA